MSACIRGCRRPCACDECKASDVPLHEPQPAPAEEGLLCKRDATRLYRWLGDVLDDTARLDTRIPVDYRLDKEGGHHKVSGSPALIRLDVAALTDHRSSAVVHAETRDYPENQDDRPPMDIPGELMSWARMFAEERELTSPVDTMARAVALLDSWFEYIVALPWVDEFYRVMHEIRQQLDRAHNVERPRPVGHCLSVVTADTGETRSCGRALYQDPYSSGQAVAKCQGCGRVYRGLDLLRAKAAEKVG